MLLCEITDSHNFSEHAHLNCGVYTAQSTSDGDTADEIKRKLPIKLQYVTKKGKNYKLR
jgi:hypothetical protein